MDFGYWLRERMWVKRLEYGSVDTGQRDIINVDIYRVIPTGIMRDNNIMLYFDYCQYLFIYLFNND